MMQKNERRSYASDLSDSQWAIIEPLFPRAGNRGKREKRELVNAVLYFVDNGRKRHIVVDTMGNLLAVAVHAANIHDTKSGMMLSRNIHPFNASAPMQGTAKPLSRMSPVN